jgi:hypothetical protein
MVTMDGSGHHIHGEGLGTECAAFKDLAHMDREAWIGAAPDGKGGDGRIVAGPARDDHLSATVERRADRLVAHLRHQGHGVVEHRFGEVVAGLEIPRLAVAHRRLGAVGGNIGIDRRKPEAGLVFGRPVDVAFRACAAGAADDQRNSVFARGTTRQRS